MSEHKTTHAPANTNNRQRQPAVQEQPALSENDLLKQAISSPTVDTLTPSVVMRIQRLYGNQFAQRLVQRSLISQTTQMTPTLLVQRGVWKEGGKNSVTVTEPARSQANFVINKNFHTAAIAGGTTIGKYTFTDIGNGTLKYEKFKNKEFCGGRTFNNGAQPDTSRLPISTTYSEWDVNQYTGGPRGTERVVMGADGAAFYTNDHYANFTEIKL